jgi:hypothetical protein
LLAGTADQFVLPTFPAVDRERSSNVLRNYLQPQVIETKGGIEEKP